MNNIDAIRALGGTAKVAPAPAKPTQKSGESGAVSFKDTLNTFMSDVNSMQNIADESIQKLAAGDITDVHQVMNSAEEAKTAFNMMMEIRGKVMDAYDEVMRMRL
jgi:flagellar hook-basal body complex protein FliE